MIFTKTLLQDAVVIEPKVNTDDRGFFTRIYSTWELEEYGIHMPTIETNYSYSSKKGTLRGMHWQRGDSAQDKLVRCMKGAIYDVIVDLRQNSPTFEKWIGIELTRENFKSLFVPRGFAHGFLTLTDDVDVTYQVSHRHVPGDEGGFRYDDPYFAITWPQEVLVISDKDKAWSDYH